MFHIEIKLGQQNKYTTIISKAQYNYIDSSTLEKQGKIKFTIDI